MATERLILEFQTKGLRTVNRQLKGVKTEASKANKTLALLRSTLVVVAGARVIGRFLELADSLTKIRNRLRLATQSTEELNAVQQVLFKISQRTQSSFEANAELFQRLTIATNGLNLSYGDLLKVTEGVANAIRISGATAQEAAGSTRQFAQALGAGAAQGEELRAIVEGNVRLAESIAKQFKITGDETAKSLGVTNAELDDATQKLGRLGAGGLIAFNKIQPGAIKTQIIVKAIIADFDQLSKEAAKIDRTVGGAFTRFNNQLILFVGGISSSIKLGENLDKVLQEIAKRFGFVATALAGILALGAFNLITGQLIRLGATSSAVLGFLTVGFRNLVVLLVGPFAAAIRGIQAALLGLSAIAASGFLPFIGVVSALVGGFFALKFAIESVAESSGNFSFALKNIVGITAGLVSGIIKSFSKIPGALGDLSIQALNGVISIFESGVNKVVKILNRITGVDIAPADVGRISNSFEGVAFEVQKTLTASVVAGAVGGFRSTDVGKGVQELADKVKTFFKDGLIPKDLIIDPAKLKEILSRLSGTGEEIARLDSAAQAAERTFLALRGQVDPLAAGMTELAKASKTLTDRFGKNFKNNAIAAETFDLIAKKVLGLKDAEFELQQRLALVDKVNEQVTLSTEQRAVAINKARLAAQEDFTSTFGAIAPLIEARRNLLQIETDVLENRKQLKAAGLSAAEAETRLLRESLGLGPTIGQVNEQIKALTENQIKLGLTSEQLAFETRKVRIAFLEQQRDASSGAERFFLKATQDATDAATQIENVLSTAFDGVTDALVEFVNTGKLSVNDLANEIQQQLLRGAIQELLTSLGGAAFGGGAGSGGLFGQVFGGSSGNGGGAIGSFVGAIGSIFAQNGANFTVGPDVSAATLSGPDNRFVPLALQDGEKVKVTPKGGGSDAPINISVSIDARGNSASPDDIGRSVQQSIAQASQELRRQDGRNN